MIYPLNIVDSKYELVHIIALRSKQMHEYKNYQMNEKNYKSSKDIGKAMEELEDGLIKIIKPDISE